MENKKFINPSLTFVNTISDSILTVSNYDPDPLKGEIGIIDDDDIE